MIAPKEEARQMAPKLSTCCDVVLSTLETDGFKERSGGLLLCDGESLFLGTSLPSEPLPPGMAGLEQRDVVGPVSLSATEEEEEEETERVGLC